MYKSFDKNQTNFEEISKQEIYLNGKNKADTTFIFKKVDEIIHLIKENKQNCPFKCYTEEEMVKLEEAVNNIKLYMGVNIFAVKSNYNIKENQVKIKNYITFILIRKDEELNKVVISHFIYNTIYRNIKDIKLVGNNELNENETKWQKDNEYFLLYYKILPNEYFVTLEFDYTLDLQETKDKLCYCIGFGKNLNEGCFLQVSSLDFYDYKFYRKEKEGKHKGDSKEGTASFETFIEPYEKKYAYDYIYLYFIALNIDLF